MENPTVPAGWAEASLGELGVWSGGGTPSKAEPAFWKDGSVPWVSPKDMKSDFILTTEDMITPQAVAKSAAKYVPCGSILMVTRSGILAHTFPVAITKCEVTVNQDVKTLTPSDEVSAEFLAWLLRRENRSILATCSKNGTTVASVDTDRLKSFRVPVAPHPEQLRIVEKIETLFARLDKGEEAVRTVQTLLKRYRQSVLKAAMTGGLTADWRAANRDRLEPGRDLLTRILKTRRETWKGRGRYSEPVAPDRSELAELPTGWVWASLAQLTHIKGGVTVDKKREHSDPITLPYLRVANVQNGYLDLSEVKEITVDRDKAAQSLLQPGDILLNEGGDRDKLGRGWVWQGEIDHCIHQNHVFRARPILKDTPSEFISLYANAFGQSFFMTKGKQSVNLASISLTSISGLPVPLPSLEEQLQILRVAGEHLDRAEAVEDWCTTELTRSAALRQSILKQAFSGRLVPQDPTDEPASALLARIRATASTKKPRKAG